MAIVTTDDQNYKDIANAIRERNGTSNTYKPREMPLAIRSISGSGSSIKFQSNKTVTPTESTQYVQPDSGYDGLQQVTVNPIPNNYQDTSDATAVSSDLLEGKVAYGTSGRIVGSLVPSSGGGDVDTSDADATASDIVAPKTAYIASGKVTGTLEEESSLSYTNGSAAYNGFGVPAIMITKTITGGRHLIKNNGTIIVSSPASNFGDASPSDVAEGKTFTSSSGLKVTGTKTDSGSSGGGSLIRYGQTTSPIIETGLSSIDIFSISATSSTTGLGLCQAVYNRYDNQTYMRMSYCNSSSQYLKMYTYTTASTYFTISGGTFEWTGTDSRAFQEDMEYAWFAVGS